MDLQNTLKPITNRPFTINMGPIHPSCYGVVRLVLSMNSVEQIVSNKALYKSKHYIKAIENENFGLLSYSYTTGKA
jgi:NADH:ubiquinone oxidoreductase subunit D